MIYRNTSTSVKTFYGVTFQPGDVHEVAGYINDPAMMKLNEMPKEHPKTSRKQSKQKPIIAKEDES